MFLRVYQTLARWNVFLHAGLRDAPTGYRQIGAGDIGCEVTQEEHTGVTDLIGAAVDT